MDWAIEVTNALCVRLDCDYGYASGVMDVYGDMLEGLYMDGAKPEEAAAKVDDASAV